MLVCILGMQRGKSVDGKDRFVKEDEAARRTTIILEKNEREYIDQLIRDGKEQGIKPLVSKMLDIYRSMMVYDWRFPGEYYCGISRVAFVNVELLNILIQNAPKDKLTEIGRRMGDALKVSLETTMELATTERDQWENVFKRLRVQGFGDFCLKDKYLLVKTPFISEPEILRGIMEGVLGVHLDLKNASPPLVFEIRRPLEHPSGK
jgi:hypothetical protein